MKVALIGGTGFVGSYLIDELIKNEHTPRLLVRKIGRNLLGPASKTDCFIVFPSFLYLFIKSTITKLSLTTTPVRATIPIMDKTDKFIPMIICPITAPVTPKGIDDITTRG